jgi:hypothetical protein
MIIDEILEQRVSSSRGRSNERGVKRHTRYSPRRNNGSNKRKRSPHVVVVLKRRIGAKKRA